MRSVRPIPAVCTVAFAFAAARAQIGQAPILTEPPRIAYPPIARAAHISGDVVVTFSIDSDGRAVSVRTVSGPLMLRDGVESAIRQWRFKTPLPVGAETEFEADYSFRLAPAQDDGEDDLDSPPYDPCCGDVVLSAPGQVTAQVHSVDGSQSIDVTPAAVVPKDRCPDDTERLPPSGSSADDFVELYRAACTERCGVYRVRVSRNGRVEWDGKKAVSVLGGRVAQISAESADALLTRFQAPEFWAACSVEPPSPEQKIDDEDFNNGDFVTVRIDGHTKSVDTDVYPFGPEDTGARFAWAIDKAADTHRWRHGDAAVEPYSNMYDDLSLPKPGITLLMRATNRFSPYTGEQSLEALTRLIATGVDVDAVDESGWSALMYAAQIDWYDDQAVRLLLDAHASVNTASLHGDTALMMAAYRGVLSKSLLDKGADINRRNADGVTALMLLAQVGNPDELRAAIAAGADANVQDNAGHTALDYLRAASCNKPFVALPKPSWGPRVVREEPAACPSKSENFLGSQAILKAAMKQAQRGR